MSINLNVIHVAGRLTKDIELKSLPTGQQIANLSVATNHVYTKDGEKKETVQFHDIILFGKQAENASKYLHKGDGVYIQGRNQTRQWEKDDIKHYRTEIIADTIQFGEKAPVPKVGNTDIPYDVPGENGIPRPEDIPF